MRPGQKIEKNDHFVPFCLAINQKCVIIKENEMCAIGSKYHVRCVTFCQISLPSLYISLFQILLYLYLIEKYLVLLFPRQKIHRQLTVTSMTVKDRTYFSEENLKSFRSIFGSHDSIGCSMQKEKSCFGSSKREVKCVNSSSPHISLHALGSVKVENYSKTPCINQHLIHYAP